MANNLKIKVIGVLRDGNINKTHKTNEQIVVNGVVDPAVSTEDGAGGGAGAGAVAGRNILARPIASKMNPLDLAGILNCRRRLEWTKEWLKKNQSEFQSKENLLKEIQFRSNEVYHLNCFLDITEQQFRFLVKSLANGISKLEPQRKKKSFSAEERLAITLKYLATGEVHSCRNYCFLASKPVILKMISEICLKMYELLKDDYFDLPKTEENWQKIVDEQKSKTKLPNCLGNLVMNEMKMFKKQSLLFTTIVDANYNFVYADVEEMKTIVQDEIFNHSNIKQKIETNEIILPPHNNEDDIERSYYFAGHGTLPVQTYLMSSYKFVQGSQDPSAYFCSGYGTPEFNFCWGMDVASIQTKYALRMLLNLFNVFQHPMRVDAECARKITLGCIALYNYLRKSSWEFKERIEKMMLIEEQEDIVVDDDGLIIDEEIRFREEFRPNVEYYSCFEKIFKQKYDTADGLAKRDKLRDYIAKNKLMD